MTNTRVVRSDDESRYEIFVGDGEEETLAGYAEFTVDGATTTFPRTIIDPDFGGRGLGTTLVAAAVADVAARGGTIVPLCPFVEKYLRGNDVPGAVVEWPDRG